MREVGNHCLPIVVFEPAVVKAGIFNSVCHPTYGLFSYILRDYMNISFFFPLFIYNMIIFFFIHIIHINFHMFII